MIKISDINIPAFVAGKNIYFNKLTFLRGYEMELSKYYRENSLSIRKRRLQG